MKKILLILLVIVVSNISSCVTIPIANYSYTNTPIKGNYNIESFVTNKNVDDVWTSIIDFISSEGISIKLIDKQSGLIVCEKTSFLPSWTFENDSSKLENIDAFIVVQKHKMGDFIYKPTQLDGIWNIRIKPLKDNKTSISVNLNNISAVCKISVPNIYNNTFSYNDFPLEAKSTGVFEKLIFNIIK